MGLEGNGIFKLGRRLTVLIITPLIPPSCKRGDDVKVSFLLNVYQD